MKRKPAPKLSGHLHFVTTRTFGRVRIFGHSTLCSDFLEVLQSFRQREGFTLQAYVLMPDHIHLIVQPRDGQISNLMRGIKSLSARKMLERLRMKRSSKLLEQLKRPGLVSRARTHQVWQQGFHTVELWSDWFIRKKIDYLHDNPVRAGLVKSAQDYRWSSFRAFYRMEEAGVPLDPVPW